MWSSTDPFAGHCISVLINIGKSLAGQLKSIFGEGVLCHAQHGQTVSLPYSTSNNEKDGLLGHSRERIGRDHERADMHARHNALTLRLCSSSAHLAHRQNVTICGGISVNRSLFRRRMSSRMREPHASMWTRECVTLPAEG